MVYKRIGYQAIFNHQQLAIALTSGMDWYTFIMQLRFWFFWTLTLFQVLVAPGLHLGKKGVFIFSIFVGVWLILGVSTYQTKHIAYEQQRSSLQSQIDVLYAEKQKLETLRMAHPTSRDVLFSLAQVAYQLHDTATLRTVFDELERLDPNSSVVKIIQEKYL